MAGDVDVDPELEVEDVPAELEVELDCRRGDVLDLPVSFSANRRREVASALLNRAGDTELALCAEVSTKS